MCNRAVVCVNKTVQNEPEDDQVIGRNESASHSNCATVQL